MAITNNAITGGTAQSKTAGTSLQVDPTDFTVAANDDVFLAYAGDDVGSSFGVAHGGTSSITWSQVQEQINAGNAKAQLWRGAVTAGGTVTTVTISWTTNVTAKAAALGWFSGVGTQDAGSPYVDTGTAVGNTPMNDLGVWQIGDLVLPMAAIEGANDVETVATAITDESGLVLGQNGTTGGGAASNIVVGFGYVIATTDTTTGEAGIVWTNSRDYAGISCVFSPAAAAAFTPRPEIVALQAVNRSSVY